MSVVYERIHIHGDNIVECERILALIERALSGGVNILRGPFGSPVCPEFELELKMPASPARRPLRRDPMVDFSFRI